MQKLASKIVLLAIIAGLVSIGGLAQTSVADATDAG